MDDRSADERLDRLESALLEALECLKVYHNAVDLKASAVVIDRLRDEVDESVERVERIRCFLNN